MDTFAEFLKTDYMGKGNCMSLGDINKKYLKWCEENGKVKVNIFRPPMPKREEKNIVMVEEGLRRSGRKRVVVERYKC